jgi:hypothetical protein
MWEETPELMGEKLQRRYEAIRKFVLAHRELLSSQGSVAVGWRCYHGRKLGPVYRLAYRHGRRQCSRYIGTSAELAEQVRKLLAQCQAQVRRKRAWQRLWDQSRRELKVHKAWWAGELAKAGFHLKGAEVRGWRAVGRAAGPPSPDAIGIHEEGGER